MATSLPFTVFFLILLSSLLSHIAIAISSTSSSTWMSARASLYGGDTTGTINGGPCGYGDLYNNGYGSNTAAVSSALFNNGASCGACFQIRCDDSSTPPNGNKCLPGGRTVIVTATNFCPPNQELPSGLCNPPAKHFDMSQPAFEQIAVYESGKPLQILFRRVSCKRDGGMLFTINGRGQFMEVLLTNVGGQGEVSSILVKGSQSGWQPLARLWGSTWHLPSPASGLKGQALSFKVLLEDGSSVTSYEVVPSSWDFGQTFEGSQAP